jgi:putative lipoic acid-binding regulatory protein
LYVFDEVKVFSATKGADRKELGRRITKWIRTRRSEIKIVDRTVRQSSDKKYHCLTITLFFRRRQS